MFVCMSICLSVYLSVCLSICLSSYLSIYLYRQIAPQFNDKNINIDYNDNNNNKICLDDIFPCTVHPYCSNFKPCIVTTKQTQ